MVSKENEEIRKHVQELLDNVLIRDNLIPCIDLLLPSENKDGECKMCTDSREFKKITIDTFFSYHR